MPTLGHPDIRDATAGEILSALDMEDYLLVKGLDATRTFYNEEDDYEQYVTQTSGLP